MIYYVRYIKLNQKIIRIITRLIVGEGERKRRCDMIVNTPPPLPTIISDCYTIRDLFRLLLVVCLSASRTALRDALRCCCLEFLSSATLFTISSGGRGQRWWCSSSGMKGPHFFYNSTCLIGFIPGGCNGVIAPIAVMILLWGSTIAICDHNYWYRSHHHCDI